VFAKNKSSVSKSHNIPLFAPEPRVGEIKKLLFIGIKIMLSVEKIIQ
jgi:hypothetical protein